jgi:signal transduction histidine kinase/PAS domain-containing protein
MVTLEEAVLADPARLSAVEWVRRVMPSLPLPLDAIARLAARLVGAPMAAVSLVGRDEEHLAGAYGLPGRLCSGLVLPMDYSVCKYVVSADHPVRGDDMLDGTDPHLVEHPLATDHGVRAFLGVPVRDGDDRPVGSLVVLDTEPRTWTDDEAGILLEIAELLHLQNRDRPAPAGAVDDTARVFLDADGDATFRHDRFLDALLDSLPVGVIACDATGKVVLTNRPMRESVSPPGAELSPDTYEGLAAHVLFDTEGRPLPPDRTPLGRARRGEHVTDCDLSIRVPGRRVRTFCCTAHPLADARGGNLGAVAVALEVTAMRRAERFRACHAEVDRCLRASDSAAAAAPGILEAVGTTLGWPAAELWLIEESTGEPRWAGGWNAPGTDFSEIFGQPVRKGLGVTGRVWETGQSLWVPDICDAGHPLTPGERRKVAACVRQGIRTVMGVPVRDGGTLLGVLNCFAGAPEDTEDLLTVLLDGVAAQVGVYVALRRAEELARLLARTKDDFIALVSHEMRTPLTSIVANASLLAEDGEHLDDDRRMMLTSVVRNATSLSEVIDTLLDLAGLDSGYLVLGVDRIDLSALVTDALDAAREVAAANGVRLGADRPAPLWIDGDPRRLRQVVDDLLSNAVKYTPPGGAVSVSLHTDGALIELRVADTGIGTPAEERDAVFDRFYRGSNVRHQGTAGNGLGLSLARTIVQLHGGTIRLTEHQPRGTAVLVRLPLRTGGAVTD